MGWEKRGNGLYYYRKHKIAGRVVSEYVGGGELGALVALLDQEERLERAYQMQNWKETRNKEEKVDLTLDSFWHAVQDLMSLYLVAAGYHQHKGQWRKRRRG